MKPLISALVILFNLAIVPSALSQDKSALDRPAVVVHRDIRHEHLSRNMLRAIFGMRLRKWPDGMPIKVFVLRDEAPLHASFSKEVLRVFPHQLRRAWNRMVYSGTGQSPSEVATVKEMRDRIKNVPGAIGYLPVMKRDQNVKILQVR